MTIRPATGTRRRAGLPEGALTCWYTATGQQRPFGHHTHLEIARDVESSLETTPHGGRRELRVGSPERATLSSRITAMLALRQADRVEGQTSAGAF